MLDVAHAVCHHPFVRADRRREVSAVVTALVAHILFLTLSPRTKLEEIAVLPPIVDGPADTLIEIDSPNAAREPAPPENRAPEATNPPGTPQGNTPRPAAETLPLAPAHPTPEPAAIAETEPEKTTPAPPSAESPATAEPGPVKPPPAAPPTDEYGSLPPTDSAPGGAGVPGLSGPLWSIPGVVPSGEAPKPAPTTITAAPAVPSDVASRVLSGTMHSRDKDLGIEVPGAGVVASSVATAMRQSALTDVKGSFEVKLSGDGTVESVRFLGSTDGDAGQWAAVAESVRKSFAGKNLQMGADKQPVTVVVKVESKLQYPAGSKEKAVAKPICANDVIERIASAIEGSTQTGGMVHGIRDDQGRFIPYSELDEERRIKFCIPIGIAVGGDLSNIGAHMTNSVRTSFQVKRAGEQALPTSSSLPVDRRAPWLPADDGKYRPPPPPPKKNRKKKPRRITVVPVQQN